MQAHRIHQDTKTQSQGLSQREAGLSGDCVGTAKTAAVKLNTGSCPPILPASGNEQGLWHALWKKMKSQELPCTFSSQLD